jgi:cobalt-zinc-cadmium resistance protein CzcA
MINKLIEKALDNRSIVVMGVIILLSAGFFLSQRLPVDVYPDLNAPVVTVITESPGMAPEDMETLVTFPLETALNSLPYIRRVRSTSALGYSKIHVEFEYGTDIYFARQLVTEKLQLIIPGLPEEVESPFMGPISSLFADAIEFTLSGEDLYQVRDFAEWNLKPRLQTIPGVSNVVNQGGFLKQFQVLLDPLEMVNYGVTVDRVIEAVAANNLNASGGFIVQGGEERIIRGIGRIESLEDIRAIVLRQKEGIPLTLGQVARVQIGPYIRRGTAGEAGREVVIVTVQNQYNANVMRTIQGVEDVLESVEKEEENLSIHPFYNQLTMIFKSFNNVLTAILFGGILVFVALVLFLSNLRSTFVVVMAIPLSAVFAVLFFWMFGLTLNIMTLGGLAIGLGMIVDSSIIMAENIYRHLQQGRGSFAASLLKGAQEVGHPIFYAVLILLAVFAPIFALQGIEGKMFIPLTFAVSSAVLGSLIVSLTVTPVLASFVYRNGKIVRKPNRILSLIQRGYQPVLRFALTRRKAFFTGAVLVVILGISLFFLIGSEFMPEIDESALLVDVLLPPEASLDESSRVASLIAQRIEGIPEVERVVRATGRARGTEHTAPVNLTHTYVGLVPKEDRHKSVEMIKTDIRAASRDIPGVLIQINAPLQHRIDHMATGTRSAIAVKIFGDNLTSIALLSKTVRDEMEKVRGVTDLQIEPISGAPQMIIRMRREKLARYGLNVKEVAEILEVALNGKVATELIETQKRYDVFVRYKESYRSEGRQIRELMIQTPAGHLIPIEEIAEIQEERDPAIIQKENALRRGMVQCNVAGRDMGGVVRDIRRRLSSLDLPHGYFITYGGTYENQIRAMQQLSLIIVLTIILVFCLLVVSFRSIRQALLILFNIPLALTGGIVILSIAGHTLSVPSIVGFIALIGIAVQDGIVLISHINGNRKKGMGLEEAVITAGTNKLRPVLMTTFTTIFGLLPLVLRNVTGSEIQKPLASVVMFGLAFSTLLTLVVLPVLYVSMESRGESART